MNEDDFNNLRREYLPKIKRLASQRLPGMTRSEVQCEIESALWTACQKYDPSRGASLETLWFYAWQSRKSHVIESFFTRRRQMVSGNPTDFSESHEDGRPNLIPAFRDVYDFLGACPNIDPDDGLWMDLGEMADSGDEDAMVMLERAAHSAGLDPDAYSTWAALAQELTDQNCTLVKRVWAMLANGFQRKEVQEMLGIGWRRYDAIMSTLRTPEVRAVLVT